MTTICFLFALVSFQCVVISTKASESLWVYSSDFSSDELANLNPQKEHELLLERFSQKGTIRLQSVLMVEMFANAIGNDFFEFISDAEASVETKATVKAAFQCLAKLRYQEHFVRSLELSLQNLFDFLTKSSSLGAAYTKLCSKLDDYLKNETCYTTFKEENKKQAGQLSKKTYQYGIPKSEEDLRKSFAELANDPQSRKLNVFFSFVSCQWNKDKYLCEAVRELEKLSGKGEAVQKIYEEATNEIILLVKDVSPAEINLDQPLNLYLNYLSHTFANKLESKLREDSNLKEDFEKIRQRFRKYGEHTSS